MELPERMRSPWVPEEKPANWWKEDVAKDMRKETEWSFCIGDSKTRTIRRKAATRWTSTFESVFADGGISIRVERHSLEPSATEVEDDEDDDEEEEEEEEEEEVKVSESVQDEGLARECSNLPSPSTEAICGAISSLEVEFEHPEDEFLANLVPESPNLPSPSTEIRGSASPSPEIESEHPEDEFLANLALEDEFLANLAPEDANVHEEGFARASRNLQSPSTEANCSANFSPEIESETPGADVLANLASEDANVHEETVARESRNLQSPSAEANSSANLTPEIEPEHHGEEILANLASEDANVQEEVFSGESGKLSSPQENANFSAISTSEESENELREVSETEESFEKLSSLSLSSPVMEKMDDLVQEELSFRRWERQSSVDEQDEQDEREGHDEPDEQAIEFLIDACVRIELPIFGGARDDETAKKPQPPPNVNAAKNLTTSDLHSQTKAATTPPPRPPKEDLDSERDYPSPSSFTCGLSPTSLFSDDQEPFRLSNSSSDDSMFPSFQSFCTRGGSREETRSGFRKSPRSVLSLEPGEISHETSDSSATSRKEQSQKQLQKQQQRLTSSAFEYLYHDDSSDLDSPMQTKFRHQLVLPFPAFTYSRAKEMGPTSSSSSSSSSPSSPSSSFSPCSPASSSSEDEGEDEDESVVAGSLQELGLFQEADHWEPWLVRDGGVLYDSEDLDFLQSPNFKCEEAVTPLMHLRRLRLRNELLAAREVMPEMIDGKPKRESPGTEQDNPTTKQDSSKTKPDDLKIMTNPDTLKTKLKPDSPKIKPDSPKIKPDSPKPKLTSLKFKPKSHSLKIKPDSPKTKHASPETKCEIPKSNLESPKIKPDRPQTKSEIPQTNLQSPKTKPESPQIKTEIPQTNLDSPKTKPESPKTEQDSSNTNLESPKTKPESPKSKAESPKTKAESPKSNPDSPKTTFDSPKTKPESPKTEPDSPKITFNSPKTKPEIPKSGTDSPKSEPESPKIENSSLKRLTSEKKWVPFVTSSLHTTNAPQIRNPLRAAAQKPSLEKPTPQGKASVSKPVSTEGKPPKRTVNFAEDLVREIPYTEPSSKAPPLPTSTPHVDPTDQDKVPAIAQAQAKLKGKGFEETSEEEAGGDHEGPSIMNSSRRWRRNHKEEEGSRSRSWSFGETRFFRGSSKVPSCAGRIMSWSRRWAVKVKKPSRDLDSDDDGGGFYDDGGENKCVGDGSFGVSSRRDAELVRRILKGSQKKYSNLTGEDILKEDFLDFG